MQEAALFAAVHTGSRVACKGMPQQDSGTVNSMAQGRSLLAFMQSAWTPYRHKKGC